MTGPGGASPAPTPPAIVLTGVSGAGKTTVGRALADAVGATLVDADDLHPPGSKAKMAAGMPLTDADREPWIDRLVAELARRAGAREPVVLACSALRHAHRRRLGGAVDGAVVVHLHVDAEELARRLAARRGHFMPASLLQSQIDALEDPDVGHDLVVDGSRPVEAVVDDILAGLDARRSGAQQGPKALPTGPDRGQDRSMGPADDHPVLDHQGLEVISADECWELLAAAPVGRVAFVQQGDPMVLPVNHAIVGRRVVFRTFRGSLLHEALLRKSVAFQVDGFDPDARTGWSVVVRGPADLAEDPAALRAVELKPWADTVDRDDWVEIVAEEISGRRIVPDAPG